MENSKQPTQAQLELEAEKARNEKIKKMIIWASAAVVAIAAVVIIYIFAIRNPSIAKADQAAGLADSEAAGLTESAYANPVASDSVALELYKKAAQLGGKSGNRAKVEAGMRLYQKGKYKEALQYLQDADVDDEIVKAGVYGLAGDCQVNLEQNDAALSSYDKAISAANGNPQLVPYFLVKKATVYRAKGDFAAEYAAYDEIMTQYPDYAGAGYVDIEKYRERAKAEAGK
jgi:hypothetical protein